MASDSPSTYVDTPGGKMMAGVIFYWGGTAWAGPATPGTYVSTPGGKIRCMAAFIWNGSAWVAQSNQGS